MTSLIPKDLPESPETFFIEVIRRLMKIVDKNIDDITALEKRVTALEEDTRLIAVEERNKKLQRSVDKLEGK